MRVVSANFRSLTDWCPDVQLLVYRENSRGEKIQPWGDPMLMVRVSETCSPQPHKLPSVCQEVRNPPAHGVRHIKLGELVTEQSWDDRIEGRAEVHKLYPGVGSSPGASGGPCLQHHLQICWLCR